MTGFKALRDTLVLRAIAAVKIPMLAYARPSVEEISEQRTVVRIPFGRRTRNHLDCMYFGALCAGAELGPGLLTLKLIRGRARGLSLIFKEFHARFLKRAEGDVRFTCQDAAALAALVDRAAQSGQREEATVRVTATCPDKLSEEPVGEFTLTISVKQAARAEARRSRANG
jgi:hypothetical protein